MAAAFPPIMMHGAFVLPLVIVGMIDASATRRRSTPLDPQLVVDDRVRALAHRSRADRVKGGGGDVADRPHDLVVCLIMVFPQRELTSVFSVSAPTTL